MRAQILAHNEMHSDPADALSLLPSITQSLEDGNRGSEPTFICIGEQLQAISDHAMNLGREAAAAVDLMDQTSGGGAIADVSALTERCVSDLRDWQTRISQRLTGVNDVASQLGRLAPSSVQLKKIAKRLNTINVYFAVESSRYQESANAFSAYTAELEKLVDHIVVVTHNIERDSADAQSKQTQAYESIHKGLIELNELATIAEGAMLEASGEVDEIVKFTTSAVGNIRQLSNEISQHIGSVVLALQFHDIVRQQVEHVVEALRDTQDIADIAVRNAEHPADESPECIGRIHSILSIQMAQLTKATSTIRDSHKAIHKGFVSIGERSSELLGDMAVVDAHQLQSSTLRAGLTRLAEALDVMRQLLENAQALGAQTGNAADLASRATLLLSESAEKVDDVNMDINIQALNAVITSLRLREKGRTLAILAEEVTALSRRCDNFVSTIVGDLEQINHTATEMSSGCQSESGERSADHVDTVTCLSDVVAHISDTCSSYEIHSMAMLETAKRVQEMILGAEEMLGFLPTMADRLQDHADAIEKILESLEAHLPQDYSGVTQVLEEHASRYTMASERETHERVLGARDTTERREQEQSTETGGCSRTQADFEADDLGDNVELF